MRRALLLSYEPAHFVELRRVARLLKASGSWEPFVHFAKTYADTPARMAECRGEGWECTSEQAPRVDASPPAAATARTPLQSAARALPDTMKPPLRALRAWLRRYPSFRARLRAEAARTASILRETKPAVVVLFEENVDHLTSVMVKEAAALRIPSVVVPFTVANALEPAEAYFGNPDYTLGLLGRTLFARLYPRWVVEHRGARLVRLPVPEAIAVECGGYAPPLPWILNSGHADAIAVESDAMFAHYRACGLPQSQLVLTGAVYDDVLSNATRDAARTRQELGLDARPVFLCALPPDQIRTRLPGQCDFATHAELAREWISTLGAHAGIQVVVSLHPRTPPAEMAFLGGLGVTIANRDVAQLIPLCDVYVASVSATIRMAIACGKPVVNYDVYRYHYTDYTGVPGVETMETAGEFRAAVAHLATDPAARAAASARQQAVKERWGRLDGRAGERLLALFERVAARKEANS